MNSMHLKCEPETTQQFVPGELLVLGAHMGKTIHVTPFMFLDLQERQHRAQERVREEPVGWFWMPGRFWLPST